MVRREALALLAVGLCVPMMAGCDTASSSSGGTVTGRKIKVTTTVGMVGDLVRNVGGDRVEVTTLMGPGVDPHLYKASEGDLRRLADADVIFYNGLNLEGKMADIFVRMATSGKPTYAVSDSVEKSLLREPPEFLGHYDPHLWFDVSMWQQTLPTVVQGLSKLDPDNASAFEASATAYEAKLKELHTYCVEQMATVPESQRVLVTAHDAFGYFGRAYKIRVLGLQGISTATEAGLKDIQRRVDDIVKTKVKAVFVESSVSHRAIEAVVAGCKARGHATRIGGTLYSDAMGEPGTEQGTYLGMVRHNVDSIVKALK